jgi:LmbE family N-acetylglucosaminyl deacetylase
MRQLLTLVCAAALAGVHATGADIVAVTNGINYNVGAEVRIRLSGSGTRRASIRYAGEDKPVAEGLPVAASDTYVKLWTIPFDARTGRYEVDLGNVRGATSFAVHRKPARIERVELDRTFYSTGDPIDCKVTIRNQTDRALENVRVEFAPYHYPWIAQAPDEPKTPYVTLADSMTLAGGAEKVLQRAAVMKAPQLKDPGITGYAVIVWDHARRHVYDLAFTLPVFVRPPNKEYPKRYPFNFLYPALEDVSKRAMAYRQFYPPQYVSSAIVFDTSHTIFPSGSRPAFHYSIASPEGVSLSRLTLRTRMLDATGRELRRETEEPLSGPGERNSTIAPLPDGRYIYEVSMASKDGLPVASNRIEFALNPLPKSILIFAAHQDDDTAHPALIRAAVENHIPIHLVYFTSGDAGGCERFYMSSCDASRAMDFGETRMAETRASLAHLGVPAENVFFLGLPDGGLEEIWLRHLKADDPYLSVLLAADHAPYNGVVQPNLPFARDPIIAVAKDFIRRLKPELIVTGHPEERHVDHRTNNWLVVKAMQELLREGAIPASTRMLVDKSYGETSWIHSPYKYERQVFFVPGEVARRGQEALWFYQSQDGNHQQADLITYDKLPRDDGPYAHYWLLDWQEHEGWNEKDLAAAAAAR